MRIEHVEFRIKQRMVYAELMKQVYDNLTRIRRDSVSRQRAETRLETLNDEWSNFVVVNDAINLSILHVHSEIRPMQMQHTYFMND